MDVLCLIDYRKDIESLLGESNKDPEHNLKTPPVLDSEVKGNYGLQDLAVGVSGCRRCSTNGQV